MMDSWIYQGRQYHWFGHGTAPHAPPPTVTNALFNPENVADRVHYAASSIIAHVSRHERTHWAAALSAMSPGTLEAAVAAWQGAASLDRDTFRDKLLGPYVSDGTVDDLRRAAKGMVTGRTYDELVLAGSELATAAQKIGVYRWAKFIADAADRAVQTRSEDKVAPSGTIGVVDVAVVPPRAQVQLAATGDYHLDFDFVQAVLLSIVPGVMEKAKLTIPDTSNPAVYGTKLHTLLRDAVRDLNLPGLKAEQSFIDGTGAEYGEVGTVRTDVVLKDFGGDVVAVWDWKSGYNPSMSNARLDKIQDAVGRKFGDVPVTIINITLGPVVKPLR